MRERSAAQPAGAGPCRASFGVVERSRSCVGDAGSGCGRLPRGLRRARYRKLARALVWSRSLPRPADRRSRVFENATTATVQVSARGVNDTAWPTPIDLSAPGNVASSPVVAVAASGFAVALWSRFDGANTHCPGFDSRRIDGAGWSAPVDLSAAGADATSPAIALSDGPACRGRLATLRRSHHPHSRQRV